jgi:hypothetical protein
MQAVSPRLLAFGRGARLLSPIDFENPPVPPSPAALDVVAMSRFLADLSGYLFRIS